MPRYEIEIILHFVERAWVELEPALAAGADAVHNAGSLQDAQVLGNGLAREARACCQLRNRRRLTGAEARDKSETSFIGKRREEQRVCRALSAGEFRISA